MFQRTCDDTILPRLDCRQSLHHALDDACSSGFGGDTDEEEPCFGFGSREGDESLEFFEVGEVFVWAREVPQVAAGVGENGRKVEMKGYTEERDCNLGRKNLAKKKVSAFASSTSRGT